MTRWTPSALASVALLATAPLAAAQPPAAAARMLVMPFENVSGDGRIFWLSEATALLLADELNALGALAITREERREAFDRLQVPPASTLTDATVIRIGQLVGASQAVVGTLRLDDDDLLVQARNIGLEAGRVHGTFTERGPASDLFAIIERLARRIAPASSRPPGSAERFRPPFGAFENYVKGLLAQTPATAVSYLTESLQAAPTFVRPRLALWEVYADQGEYERALAVVRLVPADSAWSRRARFLAGLSQLQLSKYDDAFAAFKSLADERPTAAALNNLGIVQLRRGGTSQNGGQATYFFNRAADADSSDPEYFFNLGYAYWLERDAKSAIYWLREAVRRNPADGDAHFVLGAALAAAGNTVGAAREKELARRLSSTYEEWEKRPAGEQVPRGLERIKNDVELPSQKSAADVLNASGQRDQQELTRFYLDRGRRLFQQENDREAMADLNRTLFLSPYEAEAHLLLGRIHLRAGRVAEAVDALKISLWSSETAAAHAALAEAYLEAKEPESARAEIDRALVLDPTSSEARRVLDRLPR
jgi:tetratricopeptide (TPR) repeat protein